jgi:hypothetical protein
VAWYGAEPRPPLSRALLQQQYRTRLEESGLGSSAVNVRLSAIRKLAAEAAENGWLDRPVAQGILSLKGVKQGRELAGPGTGPGTAGPTGPRDRGPLLWGSRLERRSATCAIDVTKVAHSDLACR